MKKSFLIILALAFFGTATSFGQFKFGGGLSMGTEADAGDPGFGISPRVAYVINENVAVASNFTYWFTGSDYTLWELNGDVHYIFAGDESLNFYGLAGLNYTQVKSEWSISNNDFGDFGDFGDFSMSGSYSDNEVGLNLGAGVNMGMFFGELKYTTTYDGQLVISVGVLF